MMRWLALCLVVLALTAGCGDRPLPTDTPVVVCVASCSGTACDLCTACRDWPDADVAASCPGPDGAAVCELAAVATCTLQFCAECPP